MRCCGQPSNSVHRCFMRDNFPHVRPLAGSFKLDPFSHRSVLKSGKTELLNIISQLFWMCCIRIANVESTTALKRFREKAHVSEVGQYKPVKCRQTCAVLSDFQHQVAIYIASLHCDSFKKLYEEDVWNADHGWAPKVFSFVQKVGYLNPPVSCLQQAAA